MRCTATATNWSVTVECAHKRTKIERETESESGAQQKKQHQLIKHCSMWRECWDKWKSQRHWNAQTRKNKKLKMKKKNKINKNNKNIALYIVLRVTKLLRHFGLGCCCLLFSHNHTHTQTRRVQISDYKLRKCFMCAIFCWLDNMLVQDVRVCTLIR